MASLTLNCEGPVEFRKVPGHPQQRVGVAFVRFTDLPQELRKYRNVNIRAYKRDNKFKKIRDSAELAPNDFWQKNRGLQLSVLSARPRGKKVTVEMKFRKRHGLMDGNHTMEAIFEALDRAEQAGRPAPVGFVKVEIYTGLSLSEVRMKAEGINTQTQVTKIAIMHQNEYFEPIKTQLEGHPGSGVIRYYDNQPGKRFGVERIVQMLCAFNVDAYGEDGRKHPNTYKRRDRVLNDYQAWTDDGTMDRIFPRIRDILRIHDEATRAIPVEWPGHYGKLVTGAERKDTTARSTTDLYFSSEEPEKIPYGITFGLVYPIVTGFRANVRWPKEEGKPFRWRVPLNKLLPVVIPKLVRELGRVYNGYTGMDHSHKVQAIARDSAYVYGNFYLQVENAVQRIAAKMARARKKKGKK